MTDPTSLAPVARQHLITECQEQSEATFGLDKPGAVCPALWLLSDLVALLEEFRDRPLTDLADAVRRLLAEQNFVDDNGDTVFDPQSADEFERHVALIVRALEKTRRHAFETGLWTPELACSQWFG